MRDVGEPSGPSAGRLRRLTEELNDEGLLGEGREWPDALLVELDHAARCCGFGGAFSVRYPGVSTAMADTKLEEVRERRVAATAGFLATLEVTA